MTRRVPAPGRRAALARAVAITCTAVALFAVGGIFGALSLALGWNRWTLLAVFVAGVAAGVLAGLALLRHRDARLLGQAVAEAEAITRGAR